MVAISESRTKGTIARKDAASTLSPEETLSLERCLLKVSQSCLRFARTQRELRTEFTRTYGARASLLPFQDGLLEESLEQVTRSQKRIHALERELSLPLTDFSEKA